jgi:hypothetical protein
MSATTLSKITIKKVFGNIPTITKTITDPVDKTKKDVVMLEEELPLMRVYGQATGFRVATSQYGDSCVFKGVFKAVNAETGEVFTAGECCLPKMLESQLSGVLHESEGAEFAFDIFATPSKNAFGYEYKIKSLMEVADAPVISAIEERLGMLALPNKAAKVAPAAKPAAKAKGKK